MCIAWRAEVVAVKLFLEMRLALLVLVVVEVILAMEVLHEGRNSPYHIFRREVVDIIFEELPNRFQRAELVRVGQRDEAVRVRRSVSWNSFAKNNAGG